MSRLQVHPNPLVLGTDRGILLIKIIVLIFLFDRVEFLYYGLEHPEKMCSFWIKGEPIRADSYWYFASLRIQYIIFAAIVYLLIPELKKPLLVYFWVSVLYFIEYFLTYNEPITRIPVTDFLYIPVSVTLLKFFALVWIFCEAIKKFFYG